MDDQITKKVIQTICGPCHITIIGDLSNTPILTMHDIGLNHKSCFSFLSVKQECDSIYAQFCIVHIDAPGQEDDAENLQGVKITVKDLVSVIETVRTSLSIENFIGLGVGFGAYCLAAYASNFLPSMKQNVLGLILISWTGYACGWSERVYDYYIQANYMLRSDFIPKQLLCSRYFSKETVSSLYTLYHEVLDRQNPQNLKLFLEAHSQRENITSDLKKIKCPTLTLVGSQSWIHDECLSMKEFFDPKYFEVMSIDKMSHLLTEECPKRIQEPINLFLNSLGYTN